MAGDLNQDNYPFAYMSEEDRARMPFGDRVVGDVREGGERAFEYAKNYLPAAGNRLLDMTTVGLSGDERSPELIREEAGQDVGSFYDRNVTEPLSEMGDAVSQRYGEAVGGLGDLRQGLATSVAEIYNENLKPDFEGSDLYADLGRMRSSLDEAYNEGRYGAESYYGTPAADSPDSSFYDEMMEYGGGIGDMIGQAGSAIFNSFRVAPDDETPFERNERLNAEGMQTVGGVVKETVTETNAVRADVSRGDASGRETGARSAGSLVNLDSLMNPSEDFNFAADMQNRLGTEVQGGAYGVNPNQALQDDAYAELLAGQGDVSNNLRGLIDQTRADSKQQAFYLGMAALGAGIAKGDMGGGMQEAVNIASSTTARGQDAVAPLEAALVTQGTQGPKDRIEALASMARSDAAFQQVKADILRQGRLDQQSARTLRAATLQSVTRIVQEAGGYIEGVETPQQMAEFIRAVAGQLSSEVESQIQAPTSRLTTNPETERLRFTAP